MSNLSKNLNFDCGVSSGCSAVKLILSPKEKDLGGFKVRRALPIRECRSVGPWVFFDHMGPAHFEPGTGVDVRPHPHIGLATVTYLFKGEMLHRDSIGNEVVVNPGDINLMAAGKGIVHSERQREAIKSGSQNNIHGLQLWLALPKEHELMPPAFYHYDSNQIPEIKVNDVPVRVMIGQAYAKTSPVKTFSETLYIEARLKAGQQLVLPDADERALYIVQGNVLLGDTVLPEQTMAILNNTKGISITAKAESLIAVIGGKPLGERFMEWNFVATSKELIEQAKQDWANGLFDKVPGDEKEFIPFP